MRGSGLCEMLNKHECSIVCVFLAERPNEPEADSMSSHLGQVLAKIVQCLGAARVRRFIDDCDFVPGDIVLFRKAEYRCVSAKYKV